MARCAGCGGFIREGYDCNKCGIPGDCGPRGFIHGGYDEENEDDEGIGSSRPSFREVEDDDEEEVWDDEE